MLFQNPKRVGDGGSYRVDDQVGPSTLRECSHSVDNIVCPVIDGAVDAEGTQTSRPLLT
jgi:hypothetical protein